VAETPTTRERLLDEAERLFARDSIAGVTTRQITEAAQQRNTSAVSYHFGSREGLLLELLARRGGPVDDERGALRSRLGEHPPVTELVRCLVVPYSDLLLQDQGRSYVRIVAQLRGRFAVWRVESDAATSAHLRAILDEIEARPDAPGELRRERVIALIMVMTATTAERARRVDDGLELDLDHASFVANLIDMCSALVLAPVSATGHAVAHVDR
jgi:AcrR family transcriptional regulator